MNTTTSNSTSFFLTSLILFVVVAVSMISGFRSLVDVDLGWHLAGGLWMLDHGRVPQQDPFSATANFWLCYSWFLELVFASIFESFGYRGLQMAQAIATTALSLSVIGFGVGISKLPNSDLSKVTKADATSWSGKLNVAVALAVGLMFVYPVSHLRPQLFSAMCFCLAVYWAEARQLTLINIIALSIVWANIHVYWIFFPFIVGLWTIVLPLLEDGLEVGLERGSAVGGRFPKRGLLLTLAALLAGLINPYGVKLFLGFSQYLLNHAEAYEMIREFDQLSPDFGILFWMYLVAVTLCAIFTRELIRSRLSSAYLILFLLFAGLAILRIKFIPLFGILLAPVLSEAVLPRLRSKFAPVETPEAAFETIISPVSTISVRQRMGLIVAVMMFLATCVVCFEPAPPIPDKYVELEAASKVVAWHGKNLMQWGQVNVLNHFDDGGWLALFFYRTRNLDSESRLKTTIDGRTLVMGEQRLKEFNTLRTLSPGWCEVMSHWSVSFVIIPLEMKLADKLRQSLNPDLTVQGCRRLISTIVFKGDHYLVARIYDTGVESEESSDGIWAGMWAGNAEADNT